jgi:hypothetical protein
MKLENPPKQFELSKVKLCDKMLVSGQVVLNLGKTPAKSESASSVLQG